jgi:hypothetical protein
MNKYEVRTILKRAESVIRAIRQDVQGIYNQYRSSEDHPHPPSELHVHTEVRLPETIDEYYRGQNEDRPENTIRERTLIVIHAATLLAAIIAAIFTYSTLLQVTRQATAAENQATSAREGTVIGQGAFVYFSMSINRTPLSAATGKRAAKWQFKVPMYNSGNMVSRVIWCPTFLPAWGAGPGSPTPSLLRKRVGAGGLFLNWSYLYLLCRR